MFRSAFCIKIKHLSVPKASIGLCFIVSNVKPANAATNAMARFRLLRRAEETSES